MKLIYVASPYAGDIEKNTEFAKKACRHVMNEGHAFFAPHLLYPQLLNDANPDERQAGLDMGIAVLGKCDELWACGDRISSGMQAEIDLAKQLGIPICYVSEEQILGPLDPVYAIWAKAREDGPLAGQLGFLCENRRLLLFSSQSETEVRIKDLRNLCLNTSPAAVYQCVDYSVEYASDRRMHLETLQELDMIPAFTPDKFEVKSQAYGNTGGGCMVGTVQFYLPELDKSVWVNCNDECVTITSADYMWNEDHSESWERYDDVLLYQAGFDDALPDDVEPWLPMIKKALEYTIDQETRYFQGRAFSLPTAWLPESIRENADPEYLAWLQAEGKEAQVVYGSNIEMEKDYPQNGQGTFDMTVPS
ncbi:DUF4406 domain-containing protein [Hydrogenoanaerobacterium sp.]|uniref:DUF7768 domain-containing protein n=1 Tax=Hydrogenoanaerobacterium sp. TaxID=2953763 RepID=UPI00289C249E|nr:DUF4406 domain-containing protein [Hydrogenoanaerobacterium sp.]